MSAIYAGVPGVWQLSESNTVSQTVNPVPASGFAAAVNYPVGAYPDSIVVGDFNGDSKPDLAVANYGTSDVSVLLGNGDARFQAAANYAAGNYAVSVTVGDFNGDGKADLVVGVANLYLPLHQQRERASGQRRRNIPTCDQLFCRRRPTVHSGGDFNGDGKADLAVANSASSNVSVRLGNGDGAFQTAANYAFPQWSPYSVAVADFNGDGKPDLAVGNSDYSYISVLLGNGDGTFQAPMDYAVGSFQSAVAVADFNVDGRADLATVVDTNENVAILLGAPGGTPAAVSVTPNSGSGQTQTFTLQYSDTAGASALQIVAVWFDNSTSNSASSCIVYYTPNNNEINLFNDASTATTQATPRTATTLQNSQCSTNVAASSVTTNGNTLTLTLAITFQATYTRAKYIYMEPNDISGASTGWLQSGTWSVSGAGGTPAVISVAPNSGSGTSHTFTLNYSDTAGASSLQRAGVWFDSSNTNSVGACIVYYTPSNNELNLFNDASTATTQATPGTSTTLQNSQCSVNVAAATVTLSGNNLTLSVPITFQASYTRAKYIYLEANDISGASTEWLQSGAWSVSGAGGTPAVVSVAPNSGSGTSQTFTLNYSDTAGASSLQRVAVWFDNSTSNSAGSCVVYYTPSNNEVNLFNDASPATTQATPGTSTTLSNSQCSVNVAETTVTTSGDNLTLTLAMTFQASYTCAKYIYMQANEISSATTGWQQMGTWTE